MPQRMPKLSGFFPPRQASDLSDPHDVQNIAAASNENELSLGMDDGAIQPSLSLHSVLNLYALGEFAALALMLLAGSMIYPGLQNYAQAAPYLVVNLGWVLTYALLAQQEARAPIPANGYVDGAARQRHWFMGSICALVLAFVLKISGDFSRIWFLSSYILGAALIAIAGVWANRAFAHMEQQHLIGNRIIVYGVGPRTQSLLRHFSQNAGGLHVDALFDTRATRIPDAIFDIPVSNGIDNLIAHIQKKKIDAVVMDLPWTAMDRINAIVRRLESVNVDIYLAPSEMQLINSECSLSRLGRIPTMSLFVRPMRGVEGGVKIAMDYAGALMGLLLLLPLFGMVALAIKLESRGPVFFRQPRCGMNNQQFMMYKFRSMRHDMQDRNASQLTLRSDPRVTRIGGFLRRTSIDELPQLINVLRGEMSLVGPRPHASGAKAGQRLYPEVVERYAARHRVLPGITGLAQIRGHRGTTETEDDIIARVDSDLEYIRTWSLFLDLKIVLVTAFTFLWQKRAY